MLRLIRITDARNPLFSKLTSLYTEAFPPEERRELSQLTALLASEKEMYFNAVEADGELAGLFVYWDFGSFYYLEHLAVYASMRNKKIGQQVLDWVKEHLKGIRLLEAEPADTDIAARRIKYYERNGYEVVDKSYKQPSYRPGGEEFPLWVMENTGEGAREDLHARLQTIKYKVYERF